MKIENLQFPQVLKVPSDGEVGDLIVLKMNNKLFSMTSRSSADKKLMVALYPRLCLLKFHYLQQQSLLPENFTFGENSSWDRFQAAIR